MEYSFKQLKKFWSNVDKVKGGCWQWKGCYSRAYGQVKYNYKTKGAHVLSYQLFNTDYDSALQVRHKCDNPGCVNPKHLELGTTQQNTQDRVERGRSASNKGSTNGNSKLTEDQVSQIRKLYSTGNYTQKQLCVLFSISSTPMSRIVNNEAWNHVK